MIFVFSCISFISSPMSRLCASQIHNQIGFIKLAKHQTSIRALNFVKTNGCQSQA